MASKIREIQSWAENFLKQPHPTTTVLGGTSAFAASEMDIAAERPPWPAFSVFHPEQLDRALNLANLFMQLANSLPDDEGLTAVREEASRVSEIENPDLVKYALMVFITHHPKGRRLPIPSLDERQPEKVLPSVQQDTAQGPMAALADSMPTEDDLSWYREDVKANEHHEHWHVVYPNQGIPDGVTGKRRLNDRQGELFFYMHQQMLARYETERLAVGLPPVKPLRNYRAAIPEGYDPTPKDPIFGATRFSPRQPNAILSDVDRADFGIDYSVQEHELKRERIIEAVDLGRFETAGGLVPVNIDLLGSTEESTIGSVSGGSRGFYGNHHGMGHVLLSFISNPEGNFKDGVNPPGVMWDTATAIRDPVFYRWHKHVDDMAFRWQEFQTPHEFSDAPRVLIRKGLGGAFPDVHQKEEKIKFSSPDIILCFKDQVPGSNAKEWQAFGNKTFGGENWNREDFQKGQLATDELQTMMLQRTLMRRNPDTGKDEPVKDNNGKPVEITYLDQREFFYFIRVENLVDSIQDVTVRIFLVAKSAAQNRRMWIEMDKFRQTLRPLQRAVIFRQAKSSSVIRKPAVKPPQSVEKPASDPTTDEPDAWDTRNYCDCGWPYNLLLPRGTSSGMDFRLMVMLTDWNKDQVQQSSCGSMSFCGAKDRYPDSRPMGYPFDRPFPPDLQITQTIAAPYYMHMAARDIQIKLVEPEPVKRPAARRTKKAAKKSSTKKAKGSRSSKSKGR